jgi:hypothetical protein
MLISTPALRRSLSPLGVALGSSRKGIISQNHSFTGPLHHTPSAEEATQLEEAV